MGGRYLIHMLYNSISNYPDSVDPLIFFQDVDLEGYRIMESYNNLVSYGKYSEANEYINGCSNIYGYFADYLNAIENRIFNLQKYLLTIEPKRPFVISDTEPNVNNEIIWI